MQRSDIPVLPGWVALTDAADELGVSRTAVHKMWMTDKIRSVHTIGPVPVYVMERSELDRILETWQRPSERAAQRAEVPLVDDWAEHPDLTGVTE